jgi:O-acetyl-ADP-ribose deacetylase (regulator of RNase III)
MAMHLMKVAPRGAKTGTVVVTPGFRLKQRYVFHTPGPFWSSGDLNERELLSSCYRNCLLEAESMPDVRSIAFCSISTGIYRFPLDLAAELAIGIAREHAVDSGLERIVFAMFGEPEFRAFSSAHGTV